MSINQHNYEEYFLLYADGELSAADIRAVDQFVLANPDLAVELEMFQQMILPVDTLSFYDKAVLYRKESVETGLDNFEEQVLMYVDNELDSSKKSLVETFVLQHPALQECFTLLKQTKLEPETILFPYKQSLYRKAEKKRPVFYQRWARVAIAAALIGLVVLLWTWGPDTNKPEQNFAKLAPLNKSTGQKNTVVGGLSKTDNEAKKSDKNGANSHIASTLNNTVRPLQAIKKNKMPEGIAPVEHTQNLIARYDAQPVAADSKKTDVSIAKTEPHIAISAPTQSLPAEKAPLVNRDIIAANNHSEENTSFNNIVKPAVYKELDTEDDRKSLYLGSIEINKDKLRGFFRKAGSLFRSKTRQQTEDEKSETSPAANTRSLK